MEGKAGYWEAECHNREEQVSRLKEQLLKEQELYKALSDKLKSSNDLSSVTIGLLEGKMMAMQEDINKLAKEKGELNIKVAELSSKREYDVLLELAKLGLAIIKFR